MTPLKRSLRHALVRSQHDGDVLVGDVADTDGLATSLRAVDHAAAFAAGNNAKLIEQLFGQVPLVEFNRHVLECF